MATMQWSGVIPAITTPFREDGTIDHPFMARHALWMLDAGCTAIVSLGSLGEGATLSLGPITGKLVAQTLAGETPAIPLDMLSPDRYA